MMRFLLILLVVAAIVGSGIYYFGEAFKNSGIEYEPPILASRTPKGPVVVTEPVSGSKVTSPLTITGKALGPWFFEGSLPVKLLDGKGALLAQSPAIAQTDWMVQSYVPFKAKLTFPMPATTAGLLIIEKDNPSGLPQNDAKFEVPVKFK